MSRSANCTVTPLPAIEGERRTYEGFLQPFAPHAHSHYVVGLVRQGARTLECNGAAFSLAPGDVIAFNPGDVHGCAQCGSEPLRYESLVLPERALDGVRLGGPVLRGEGARTAFLDASHALAEATSEADATCAVRALAARLGQHAQTPAAKRIAQPRKAACPGARCPEGSPHHEAALRAHAHLREHVAAPDSVRELARREGISEYALIRAYRRAFGTTPSQHLLSMRVDCARELLASGESPAAVAAETGFADQAHLTRAFKQRIGATPAAYRAMAAESAPS